MADWPYNTRNWQRLRLAKLAVNPLCYACELRGRAVQAVAVDHVKAINAGGDPFPDFDGLMSLCERCHNEKTKAVDHRDSGSGRRFKGFDLLGNPIDPDDDWHGGGASNHGKG
jgi:5-methylcytosine-specific restriction endonuclease McrA